MVTQIIIALAITAAILILVLIMLTLAAAKRAKSHRSKEVLVLRSGNHTDDEVWQTYDNLVNALMQKANCNFSIAGSEFYDGGELDTPDFVMIATEGVEDLFGKVIPHLGKTIRLITPSESLLETTEKLRGMVLTESRECETIAGTTENIVNQVRERN